MNKKNPFFKYDTRDGKSSAIRNREYNKHVPNRAWFLPGLGGQLFIDAAKGGSWWTDRQTTGRWFGLVILDPKPELRRSKRAVGQTPETYFTRKMEFYWKWNVTGNVSGEMGFSQVGDEI